MFAERISEEFLAKLAATLKMRLTRLQGDAVRLIASYADEYKIEDVKQVAYMLATCYHECRFKSIVEIRAQKGTTIYRMQNKYWASGYYGRGYVQLTWKKNYEKFSPIVGLDLAKFPNLVLRPQIGARILVVGMKDGLFSGKKLADYFPGKGADVEPDWLNARKIVNGTFQNELVAKAAVKILGVLFVEADL